MIKIRIFGKIFTLNHFNVEKKILEKTAEERDEEIEKLQSEINSLRMKLQQKEGDVVRLLKSIEYLAGKIL